MKIKCEFCGSMINDTQMACPHCGAPNERVRRASGDQPVTIEQLKQWYESKGLPPYEVTRFFIGIDYREPRASGTPPPPRSNSFPSNTTAASGRRTFLRP